MKKKSQPTCTLCKSVARKHLNLWQCMRNPRHIADLNKLVWFEVGPTGN